MGQGLSRQVSPKSTTPGAWGQLRPGATVLVDTAPFIYILEDKQPFAALFNGLFEWGDTGADAGGVTICLSVITLAEVLTGPYQAGLTALAKRYESVLSGYEVLPVSPAIAALAAQLRAQYKLRLPDALQLATALDAGVDAFVTHDRDFSKVTGLRELMGDASLA